MISRRCNTVWVTALVWMTLLTFLVLGSASEVQAQLVPSAGFPSLNTGSTAPSLGGTSRHAHASAHFRVVDRRVDVAIDITIKPTWHLYDDDLGAPDGVGLPTNITLNAPGVTWAKPIFPKPHKLIQKGLGKGGADTWVYSHEGAIRIFASGKITGATPSQVSVVIKGLTCQDNGSCVPYNATLRALPAVGSQLQAFASMPTADNLDVSQAPDVTDQHASKTSLSSPDSLSVGKWPYQRRTDTHTNSLWMYLGLAFLAGMILNIMPCVLPVVSIKVLGFVQQAGESKQRVLALGIAFSAGMLVVFEILAAVAVTLQLGWGQQFQSQAFVISMISLVFLFGLSLLGVFEIPIPGMNLSGADQREGLSGAFAKGMLATLLATPCSGPFLGSTLAWAVGQSSATIFAVFTALGLGMALPYIFLTANPTLLALLPKPGNWMITFKQITGFILLATVVYLMLSIKQDALIFVVAYLVFLGVAAWFYGKYANMAVPAGRRTRNTVLALAVLAVSAWACFAWAPSAFKPTADRAALVWEPFDEAKLAQYHKAGRSVFLDWTANWCPNCKLNEYHVFESPEIVALLKEKNVVAMKADITFDTPETQRMKALAAHLGGYSIPFLAVFPGDEPFKPFTLYDVVTRKQFGDLLRALPDSNP